MPAAPRPDYEQLATELLDDVARSRARRRPAVPLLLRSRELLALAPPLQQQVLAHARRGVARDPRIVLALVGYGAAALALLFVAAPRQLGLLVALGWIPVWLGRSLCVRQLARQLARELAALP
jgi:hypothetical protein